MNDESIGGGDRGVWDRVWRGRASSLRRNLANVASQAARIASLVAEGARLVDALPEPDRQVEVLGIADELDGLAEMTKDAAKIFRTEAIEQRVAVPRGWLRRLFGV